MEYLTSTTAYPIVTYEKLILPSLRDPFCRAVILRDPQLTFDSALISARSDPALAQRYWHDDTVPRGRLASGRTVYTENVTIEQMHAEAKEASIAFNTATAVTDFTTVCNSLRGIFTRVFAEYSGIHDAPIRGFSLFTPIGGLGRSPELHIDNTILTLHWSAALATFPVVDTDLPEHIWQALDRTHQNALSPEDRAKNHAYLIEVAGQLPMIENQIGDVMITKGQRGKDLTKPNHRDDVCVHASSPSITLNGQAGFLMTPKIPDQIPIL